MTDEKKPKLIFLTESLPEFILDVPYELWLQVDGATQPVTFEIENGQFPPGISLSSEGQVYGTPFSGAQASTVFITVSDATGASETQAFDCEVSEPDGEGS